MDDANLARFDILAERMPRIAAALDAFTDPALRQQAYYSLLNMLDPEPADPEPYVFDLLDAFLTGEPLNFRNHPVPAAVRERLDAAYAGDALGGVYVARGRET